MNNKKDTFCILPFINMTLAAQGYGKGCCIAKNNYRKDDNKPWNLNNDTLEEMWNSESANKLRDDLIKGIQNPNCEFCWKDEAAGKISKRMRDNEKWQHIKTEFDNGRTEQLDAPISFELSLGTACNLKCRFCGYMSSSLWNKETTDLNLVPESNVQYVIDNSKWAKDDNDIFWDSFRKTLPYVEHMEFYGGEPFLSKKQFELLEECAEKGYSKNQFIHYNTNCTIYPKKAVEEIWPQFKEVSVMFSVDGVGSHVEYIRHPANWELLQTNMNKMMANSGDNVRFSICYTFNMMNFYYLPEMIEWCIQNEHYVNVWLNTLFEPAEFCVKNYPESVKQIITDKLTNLPDTYYKYIDKDQLQQCLDFMNYENYNNMNGFWKKIDQHDLYRGELFEKTFPELYRLLK